MDEVLTALKVQIAACGLVETAHMLGHNNTQTVQRWIKQGKIPNGKIKGTRAILEANKVMKAKKILMSNTVGMG